MYIFVPISFKLWLLQWLICRLLCIAYKGFKLIAWSTCIYRTLGWNENFYLNKSRKANKNIFNYTQIKNCEKTKRTQKKGKLYRPRQNRKKEKNKLPAHDRKELKTTGPRQKRKKEKNIVSYHRKERKKKRNHRKERKKKRSLNWRES